MRLIKTVGLVLAALSMLGGLVPAASARAADVEWRVDAELKAYDQELVVDRGSGDVLALLQSGDGTEVVRRLDGATGEVEWTLPAPWMSHVAVDPSTGQVVLAGSRDSEQSLMFVSADGQVVREVAAAVPADLLDLAIDEVSGQVCTLGSQRTRGERSTTWTTSCWTAAGDAVFADQRPVPGDRSRPDVLAIDPQSHRVYAAGTAVVTDGSPGRREVVILLAYDASGALAWEARQRTVGPRGNLAMAVDPDRGRIHVVKTPGFIQSPVALVSFDDRGRTRFTRGWEDLSTVYESAVAVTSRGHVLIVGTDVARAGLRAYSPSGRLLRSAVVRTAPNPREAYHHVAVIDARRERAHLMSGGGDTPSRVKTYDFRGRRLSNVVVDRRKVIEGSLAVDLRSGRTFVSTSLSRGPGQRISALRR